MGSKTTWQIIGWVATGLGVVASIIGQIAGEGQQNIVIDEKVTKAVNAALKNEGKS